MSGDADAIAMPPAYGPLCTAFYDLDKPAPPADALAFYLQRCRQVQGPVLEPMCGSGRFLVPLARAGLDIDGTDAAPAMLAACRRHADQAGVSPGLYLQSMGRLALPRLYRLAMVPSGSIGLLSPTQLPAALASLHAQLEPGAALLLELIQPEALADTTPPPPRELQIDAHTRLVYHCQPHMTADGQAVVYQGRYEKYRDNTLVAVEQESLQVWRHTPETLLTLLRASGFTGAFEHRHVYDTLAADQCVLIEAIT